MPNIVKGFYIIFFSLFLSISGSGQILLNTNINLNAGGQIYDAEYIELHDIYIIVGDFSSVDGQTRNNIAFLDGNLVLINDVYFNDQIGTNGDVHTVGFYRHGLGGSAWNTAVYFGGSFTQFTYSVNYTREGAARLDINDDGSSITGTFFNTWDPDFDYGVVYEIKPVLSGRVMMTGEFQFVNDATTSDFRDHVCSFTSTLGTLSSVPNTFDNSAGPCFDFEYTGGRIFYGDVGGNQVTKTMFASATEATYTPLNADGCYIIDELDDSLMLLHYDHLSGGNDGPQIITVIRKSDLTEKTDHPYYSSTNFVPIGPLQSSVCVKENLYVSGLNGMYSYDHTDGYLPSGISAYQYIPFNTTDIYSIDHEDINLWNAYSNVRETNNLLFASYPNLGSINGQTRIGLAVFCLKPDNAEPFTSGPALICQRDTATYTIPVSDDASGYVWTFSGTGVDIGSGLGQGNSNDTYFVTTPNSVDIAFLDNFSPGTLTVTPFNNCNGNTVNGDSVFSKSQSIFIGTHPLPNAHAGLDTIINCYNDSVVLNGFSDTAGVIYSWNQVSSPFLTDSLGQNFTALNGNNYILSVEAPNGCFNFDTVFVDYDKTVPTFDIVPPGTLGCDDTIYFLGHCNNTADTLSWWEKQGDPTQLMNPLECTTPGLYNFYTIDTVNGCQGNLSPSLNVPQVIAGPNIELTGYDSLPPLGVNLDTLNCTDTFFNLSLYSDTTNAVLNWVDSDTLNPSGDTQIITSQGIYYIEAYNVNNNCYNYNQVFIDIDTLTPTVIIDNPNALNCSNSTVNLNGTVYPDYVLQWDGNSIPSSPNPVTVSVSEYYTLTITDTSNGCVNQDSVLVIQNNSIDILTSNDTVVCDQFVANVSASYVGTITGITYLWDNSETTPSATYTGGDDDYAIIEIFGDAGCYGTDTVFINIPPTPVMEFTGYQPCDSPTSGYIVVNPISGWAPFDYSTDGGTNYQSSATLGGLTLGTHTVTVRDSLNCEYDFPASISETSSIATPEFLFQTYNYQSDTVIVIDVSNPATDSVDWYFSPEIILLDENNGSPIIILPDTGSFQITMDAYYGTCISSITKEIFVSELDTNSANPYNDNGIKSIGLYPNPTSGTFTVEVEFYNSQTASLSIQDMLGYVYDFEEYPESLTISQTFTMAGEIDNGTYILRVLSEFDSAYITFILNR